jgi:hypothetical protein
MKKMGRNFGVRRLDGAFSSSAKAGRSPKPKRRQAAALQKGRECLLMSALIGDLYLARESFRRFTIRRYQWSAQNRPLPIDAGGAKAKAVPRDRLW